MVNFTRVLGAAVLLSSVSALRDYDGPIESAAVGGRKDDFQMVEAEPRWGYWNSPDYWGGYPRYWGRGYGPRYFNRWYRSLEEAPGAQDFERGIQEQAEQAERAVESVLQADAPKESKAVAAETQGKPAKGKGKNKALVMEQEDEDELRRGRVVGGGRGGFGRGGFGRGGFGRGFGRGWGRGFGRGWHRGWWPYDGRWW